MATARMSQLTDDEKIQAIKLYNPQATEIKALDNGAIRCEIDGKHYEIEVYISWESIKFNGFSEGLFDGGRANIFHK